MTSFLTTHFTRLPRELEEEVLKNYRAPDISISTGPDEDGFNELHPLFQIKSTNTIRFTPEIPSDYDLVTDQFSLDVVEAEKLVTRYRKFRQQVVEKNEKTFRLNDELFLKVSNESPVFTIGIRKVELSIEVSQTTMIVLVDRIVEYVNSLIEKYK